MVKTLTKLFFAVMAALLPDYAEGQSLTVNVKDGDPVTLQTSQIESITFTDNLSSHHDAPKIGDFYYADGTWSSEIDYSKNPIGVVFYTGNPTAEDPVLKADFPNCNHGLVIAAFAEEPGCMWQNNYQAFGSAVGKWVTQNLTGYVSTESNFGKDEIRNSILGYNNTKAIRAFNNANTGYTVIPVEKAAAFEAEHSAPESSSGWYVPSIKELFLLINGEMDNAEVLEATTTHKNIAVIDNALLYIIGAKQIYNSQWAYNIWASTEYGAYGYTICTYDGKIEGTLKENHVNFQTRFILAF